MNSLKKNILVTDPSLKKIPQDPGIIQNNKTNVIVFPDACVSRLDSLHEFVKKVRTRECVGMINCEH